MGPGVARFPANAAWCPELPDDLFAETTFPEPATPGSRFTRTTLPWWRAGGCGGTREDSIQSNANEFFQDEAHAFSTVGNGSRPLDPDTPRAGRVRRGQHPQVLRLSWRRETGLAGDGPTGHARRRSDRGVGSGCSRRRKSSAGCSTGCRRSRTIGRSRRPPAWPGSFTPKR